MVAVVAHAEERAIGDPTVKDRERESHVRDPTRSWCEPAVKYHYLHRRFTHRVVWERWPFGHQPLPRGGVVALPRFMRQAQWAVLAAVRATLDVTVQSEVSRHRSVGEFGWGGTPFTRQRRRPEALLRWNRNLSERRRPKVLLMLRLSV